MSAVSELTALAQRGRDLLDAVVEARRRLRSKDDLVASMGLAVAGGLLSELLVGLRSPGQRIVRALSAAQRESETRTLEKQIEVAYSEWKESVEAKVGNMALPPAGRGKFTEGGELVRMFRAAIRKARVETRLRHGINFLEAQADKRAIGSSQATITPAHPQSKPAFLKTPRGLSGHSGPYTMWRGAVTRFNNRSGADWEAQVVISCRRSLEATGMAVTGVEGSAWLGRIRNLPIGRKGQSEIKAVLKWLNEWGSHGDHAPTPEDAEHALARTSFALNLLLAAKQGG